MPVTRRSSSGGSDSSKKNPDPSQYHEPGIKLDSGDPSDPMRGKGLSGLDLDAVLGGRLNFPNIADDVWDNRRYLVSTHGYEEGTKRWEEMYPRRPVYNKFRNWGG